MHVPIVAVLIDELEGLTIEMLFAEGKAGTWLAGQGIRTRIRKDAIQRGSSLYRLPPKSARASQENLGSFMPQFVV
jgi:hypothetical protein